MPSVLLVEDHAKLRQMIAQLLREQEKLMVWALMPTAEAALEALLTRPDNTTLPDVVVTDIVLPGMNGIELVLEIRQRYPDLPCLIMSGNFEPYTIRQVLNAGAQGFIAKDDASSLGEAIQTVLKGENYLSQTIQTLLGS